MIKLDLSDPATEFFLQSFTNILTQTGTQKIFGLYAYRMIVLGASKSPTEFASVNLNPQEIRKAFKYRMLRVLKWSRGFRLGDGRDVRCCFGDGFLKRGARRCSCTENSSREG